MLSARQVAQYFLSKDTERLVFNKDVTQRNGRKFYDGNARLNKYLHMAQNIYIAKTGEKLFQDDLYAYDNGAVSLDVQTNYAVLHDRSDVPYIPGDVREFLDKIYKVLAGATLEELIELSHEDSEWVEKSRYYAKPDQRMDSLSRTEEYRVQYADILRVMDRLPA